MYDLAPVLGTESLSSLPPGSSLLLADAGRADIDEWLFALLVDGLQNGDGAVVVSTDEPATAVVDALDDRGAVDPQSICVIECAGEERSRRTLDSGVFVYSVPGSDDLTGIGIGLAACFERLEAAGYERSRVGFRSLSSILDAAGEKAAFKFAHVVTSRLGSADFLGVFGLEQPYDPESKRILIEAFDRTIELKATADGTKRRVQDRQHRPDAWQAVGPPGSDR